MTIQDQCILIVAGEASGDLLGAHLAKAIQSINSNVSLIGMGGLHMRETGVEILIDPNQLSIVGVWEVFKHIGSILSAMNSLKNIFKIRQPDLVIFIDYPGFNLYMAKHAKKAGIKVLYYVSPQIWAWRYGRIKKIKKYVDRMAVLLPFEEKIYQKENVPVNFVGHPMVDIITPTLTREKAYPAFNLDPKKPIIGLLPGSRHNEITTLMPNIISAVQLIREKIIDAQFVLPLAPNLSKEDIQPYLIPEIQVICNNTYNVLPLCNCAVTASGTATLEIALNKIPMVIIYKVSSLSYWLGVRLIKVPFIGLCNLVAEERVAVELIQKDVLGKNIADEVIRLLNETDYRQWIVNKLHQIRTKLGEGGSSQKAASVAIEMLKESSP